MRSVEGTAIVMVYCRSIGAYKVTCAHIDLQGIAAWDTLHGLSEKRGRHRNSAKQGRGKCYARTLREVCKHERGTSSPSSR